LGGVPQPLVSHVSGPGGGPVNAKISGGLGAIGPVTVAGIPDTFHIDITHLPKIQLGIDPLTINPVDVGIRIEKIPDTRVHLPADFRVGFSLLGVELMCVRLCGEAQAITEPYVPNPCEHCGPTRITNLPSDLPSQQPGPASGTG
jgi:hypothetical protein